MKTAEPSSVWLRRAAGEDEAFILELERSAMRKLFEAVFGHWTPRPGMGAAFPASTWIIQHRDQDVGCITLHEEHDVVEIEQLYIKDFARWNGIGSYTMRQIIAYSIRESKLICVSVIKGSRAQRFFDGFGFVATSESANKVSMKFIHPKQIPVWTN